MRRAFAAPHCYVHCTFLFKIYWEWCLCKSKRKLCGVIVFKRIFANERKSYLPLIDILQMQEKLLPSMEFLQMQEKVVCLRKCFCKCRKKLCAFDRIFAMQEKLCAFDRVALLLVPHRNCWLNPTFRTSAVFWKFGDTYNKNLELYLLGLLSSNQSL